MYYQLELQNATTIHFGAEVAAQGYIQYPCKSSGTEASKVEMIQLECMPQDQQIKIIFSLYWCSVEYWYLLISALATPFILVLASMLQRGTSSTCLRLNFKN